MVLTETTFGSCETSKLDERASGRKKGNVSHVTKTRPSDQSNTNKHRVQNTGTCRVTVMTPLRTDTGLKHDFPTFCYQFRIFPALFGRSAPTIKSARLEMRIALLMEGLSEALRFSPTIPQRSSISVNRVF
jgi:hypothetical protein